MGGHGRRGDAAGWPQEGVGEGPMSVIGCLDLRSGTVPQMARPVKGRCGTPVWGGDFNAEYAENAEGEKKGVGQAFQAARAQGGEHAPRFDTSRPAWYDCGRSIACCRAQGTATAQWPTKPTSQPVHCLPVGGLLCLGRGQEKPRKARKTQRDRERQERWSQVSLCCSSTN